MALRLGDIAPNFDAETTIGKINFHEWCDNKWVVFFSHPLDFTPVCTTELGVVSLTKKEFEKRKVKPIAISIDTVESHLQWVKDINETQNTVVDFPIIGDPTKQICNLYGMIHPNSSISITVRTVFVIAPDLKIKLIIAYPASTGRNFDEIFRVIDSLQLTSEYNVVTPANWKDGDDVIVNPSIKTEEISNLFPKGFKVINSYLRTTPQPNK